MKKKKKSPRRDKAGFRKNPSTGKSLAGHRYDSKPGTIMSTKTQNQDNRADTELRKLVTKKGVFPSSPDAIKKGNTNPRRNH